jgi:hypothetical protein
MLIQQLFKITDNLSGESKASNPCIRRFLFSPNKKQQNVSGYVIMVLMEKERINARIRTINLSITSKF